MTDTTKADLNPISSETSRRGFIRAASIGMVGVVSLGTAATAQSVRKTSNVAVDPVAPEGLGPKAVIDQRFPLSYQEPVSEAARVMMDHLAALGRRDIKALADTFHYPFASFEGMDLVEIPSREVLIAKPPASLNMTNNPRRHTDNDGYMKAGSYDVFHGLEVLITHPVNCCVAMSYDRYDRFGKKLLRCEGIYAITNNDGKWAIQLASTIFTPADMIGTVYEDTILQAKRIRLDHDISAQTGDEAFDRSHVRLGKVATVRGGGAWNQQVKGKDKVMQAYAVKGVKSRLVMREITPETSVRGDRGTYQEYWDGMSTLGLGPWGFVYGTWKEGRVVHHTVDKAHMLSAAVRYNATGEEMSLAVQATVVTYRNAKWAIDGALTTSTPHDRANDIHPGGLSPE